MYWWWVQQFRGNRDEKTHTYPLELANLVGEEVMVHLRLLDVGQNGRKHLDAFVLVGVEEQNASLAECFRKPMLLLEQCMHGGGAVVAVIDCEPPELHILLFVGVLDLWQTVCGGWIIALFDNNRHFGTVRDAPRFDVG